MYMSIYDVLNMIINIILYYIISYMILIMIVNYGDNIRECPDTTSVHVIFASQRQYHMMLATDMILCCPSRSNLHSDNIVYNIA